MFARPSSNPKGVGEGRGTARPGPLALLGAAARDPLRRAARRLRGSVDRYLLLVLLLSLFPIAPLLQQGFMWDAHDARHDVYFLFELDRGIRDGILYPRWQPDFAFGFGYPFFNIYGPFATYVGEALHLLGLDFTGAVKAVFLLSIVGSGLAMYGFARSILGRRAGLVAAVAYMVIPYRLVDVYVRAALAEAVAFAIVPLVLWAASAALRRPRLDNVLALAAAYALLVVTHPLTALLLTAVLVIYAVMLALVRVHEEQPFREMSRGSFLPLVGHLAHRLLPAGAGLLLGLGLSAFFLVPAMLESRFVRVDQWYGGRYAWGGDFVELFQLFSPAWGWGTSEPGPGDSLSFQLGAVPLVLALFAVAGLFRRCAKSRAGRDGAGEGRAPRPGPGAGAEKEARALIAFFAAMALACILLMLSLSVAVWEALSLARLVQFPWRLLALVALALSFLSGAVFWRARSAKGWHDFSIAVPVILLVLGSLPYMQVEMSERDVSMAGLMTFQQSSDEMTGSTAWVKTIPTWSSMADLHVAGLPVTSKIEYDLLYQRRGVHARTLELHTNRELIEYTAPKHTLISFNIFYYPGWQAYLVDAGTGTRIGELPTFPRGDLGLTTVLAPPGTGRVLLQFEDTPLRRASSIVTWLSAALCAAALAARKKIRRLPAAQAEGKRMGRGQGL